MAYKAEKNPDGTWKPFTFLDDDPSCPSPPSDSPSRALKVFLRWLFGGGHK
jgi:hypothetical protein